MAAICSYVCVAPITIACSIHSDMTHRSFVVCKPDSLDLKLHASVLGCVLVRMFILFYCMLCLTNKLCIQHANMVWAQGVHGSVLELDMLHLPQFTALRQGPQHLLVCLC